MNRLILRLNVVGLLALAAAITFLVASSRIPLASWTITAFTETVSFTERNLPQRTVEVNSQHISQTSPTPGTRRIVKLLVDTPAHTKPRHNAREIKTVSSETAIAKHPTVLPVVRRRYDRDGELWLRVRLPGRPNESKGWISANTVQSKRTSWYVVASLHTRKVYVYRYNKLVKTFPATIGKKSTPTPTGYYFITETVRQPKRSAIGPWVLALNAYSNVHQTFNGGPGQIALHGQGRLRLGDASSNGCIRIADADITWMAANLPAGTTVNITRKNPPKQKPQHFQAVAVNDANHDNELIILAIVLVAGGFGLAWRYR